MISSLLLTKRVLTPSLTPLRNCFIHQCFADNKPYSPKSKQEAWLMQEQQKMKTPYKEQSQDDRVGYSGYSKSGLFFFGSLTLLLGYFYYNFKKAGQSNLDVLDEGISGLVEEKEKQSLVGGDWTLIDSTGQPISSRYLQGSYYLILFSYTNSPDFCASALYYLSTCYRVIRNLPEGAYLKLKIVFVSIDPERDTPYVMTKFLKNFGKQVIGVTGTSAKDPELIETLKKFRIRYKKVDLPPNSVKKGYQFDHSTNMYLMDPDNIFLYQIDDRMSEHESAREILQKVIENEHKMQKLEQKMNQK